jgi:hypothetical protein
MHIDFFTHALDARANYEICQILPDADRLEDAYWDAHISGQLSYGLMGIDQVPELLAAREPLAKVWKQGWMESRSHDEGIDEMNKNMSDEDHDFMSSD